MGTSQPPAFNYIMPGHANNPEGQNGIDNGIVPSDEILRAELLSYSQQRLNQREQRQQLKKKLNYDIGRTKLWQLQQKFDVPTARKMKKQLTEDQARQLVLNELDGDTLGLGGSGRMMGVLARQGTPLPRSIIRQHMKELDPEGPARRFPGKRPRIHRVPLQSLGPFHEIHADGHDKNGDQALGMGGVGLPIYAFRDKFSGAVLRAVVIPNNRLKDVIAHVYLDLVAEYRAIPIQLTTDKGSEIGTMVEIQTALRERFTPDLPLDEFPPALALRSVHNTVIESWWRWLRQHVGLNFYEDVVAGKNRGIFIAGNDLHINFFNWLWPPILQSALDKYIFEWNTHRIRFQHEKVLPSGARPLDIWSNPEDYNGTCMAIPVDDLAVLNAHRDAIPIPREEAFRWVSDEFMIAANAIWELIGSPVPTSATAWVVFETMLPHFIVTNT